MFGVAEYNHLDIAQCQQQLKEGKAVVLRGLIKQWPAVNLWSPTYFKNQFPQLEVTIKYFGAQNIRTQHTTMQRYVDILKAFQAGKSGHEIPYCHDIPIFLQTQDLLQDIGTFPSTILPSFYREQWWKFVQFFMSPSGAVTPLHFDTLRTNNLFFQVAGKKRFTLVPWHQRSDCHRRGWRWFDHNPEQALDSDIIEHRRVEIDGGDVLIMPAGMLHHVRTLTDSISFNIDYHTKATAFSALTRVIEKMPRENLYYNAVSLLGLAGFMRHDAFFKRYRSYLNYIS
ncbi:MULTISPECIES: cupin-like domain-containing protein [unclassified Pseudoalteromonas]|uniref:cupin-like domain-containing protein n=1 Tax=unclassified Pseudoalteromonas TaxID=194690 RepID=UPI001F2FAB13|nr:MULTISPECIES: cupin-like domain-containing protein [unclassified Pseudoalteromonas]MCF2825926.1 cupin-like domain-containing protein [Pseudoalteromonas sp. OF5H-5]MCF2829948.1 cupin-like domain-containing protein [Pseudoalteromonas sp. DL2-H6]MCF2925415.1 cupin-like domain-containing protein [Pseudoalteromonas sp. DL2-H1]